MADDVKNELYAKIELKHIRLELRNNRTQHFRHFIDQYFCYKNEYVNKAGNANWNDILWNENVSILARKETDNKKITKDHVIPLKCITRGLVALTKKGKINLKDISNYLDKNVLFATITKEENKRLNDAKLKEEMPSSYYEKGHLLFQHPFARYKSVGIELE